MSCKSDMTSPCEQSEHVQQAGQMPNCDKDDQETVVSWGEDSSYTSSDDEDHRRISTLCCRRIPPEKYFFERYVVKGKTIVLMAVNTYAVRIKDEYKPKDVAEQKFFYISLLDRVVINFAAEAYLEDYGGADFRALLTEEEHRKFCRMKEVASANHRQAYVYW